MTHDAPREAARHQREPDEQEQPRAPHGAAVRVRLLAFDAVLVDHVHDEEAKHGEDARDPVHEGHVHGRGVVRRVGRRVVVRREDHRVQEEPVRERKLQDCG